MSQGYSGQYPTRSAVNGHGLSKWADLDNVERRERERKKEEKKKEKKEETTQKVRTNPNPGTGRVTLTAHKNKTDEEACDAILLHRVRSGDVPPGGGLDTPGMG